MLRCRVLGHRYRFTSSGPVMTWRCERGCDAGGKKSYATPADAARYAAVFDREDRDDIGKRAPLFAGLPLRILRVLRRKG